VDANCRSGLVVSESSGIFRISRRLMSVSSRGVGMVCGIKRGIFRRDLPQRRRGASSHHGGRRRTARRVERLGASLSQPRIYGSVEERRTAVCAGCLGQNQMKRCSRIEKYSIALHHSAGRDLQIPSVSNRNYF